MSDYKNIEIKHLDDLDKFNESKFNQIVISTPFETQDIYDSKKYNELSDDFLKFTTELPHKLFDMVDDNGFVFIYGIPQELIYYAYNMNDYFNFKYWIALDINHENVDNKLPHSHMGVLMYHKPGRKSKLLLNTKETRIPYVGCSYCGKNVKDWGGKKHQMNKKGTAISDVWKDFYAVNNVAPDPQVKDIELNFINIKDRLIKINNNVIPDPVLKRIRNLTEQSDTSMLNIRFDYELNKKVTNINIQSTKENIKKIKSEDKNKVLLRDSIEYMRELLKKYPDGCFDLVFADPPYNLEKNYEDYDDSQMDQEYIDWCDEWLSLCAKLLKPTGSLFVLNIPKWSIHHARNLSKELYLQNWIVWDALSTPMGKIMPAHYSLLYYTKSKNGNKYNSPGEVDSPEYCLRKSCIKKRKNENIDNKLLISDIWTDIHRIKHKKDRDTHPCQLPIKLMERIIEMATDEEDLVFDPFCGAGTTAIVAKKLNRNYLTTDISEEYVEIAERGLNQVEEFGELVRDSVKRPKRDITKKEVELRAQELAQKLDRKPTLEEFLKFTSYSEELLNELYGNPQYPLKASIIKV
ncbi:site-specific DNA-methyltransferase (adenine-specific) [Alkalibacillus filiformis]|uniref:Site-specific DNA-methyltransferase (Adenine-specific) n=1 Tax=Alkalibacillus filiformis TaxID=200990 RepID=A0ABU0DPI5_9BACI|nr:site-specific DNA-methyltransferase [Alkalibacillus filiformis]MDQ0350359.1 site-specific DNA-methyltransferase (adenine-specific) [Alkalibacillus filiformis]